jgi:Na+-transporting NADH:ubiquinone oxidoreductase subunit NqrB
MKATKFEFKYRFFIIALIFAIGFFFYNFDPISLFVALQRWLAPGLSHYAAVNFQRTVIAMGALLVFGAAILRTWASAYLRIEVVHASAGAVGSGIRGRDFYLDLWSGSALRSHHS